MTDLDAAEQETVRLGRLRMMKRTLGFAAIIVGSGATWYLMVASRMS